MPFSDTRTVCSPSLPSVDARFRLRSGKVFPRRIVHTGDRNRLDGDATMTSYTVVSIAKCSIKYSSGVNGNRRAQTEGPVFQQNCDPVQNSMVAVRQISRDGVHPYLTDNDLQNRPFGSYMPIPLPYPRSGCNRIPARNHYEYFPVKAPRFNNLIASVKQSDIFHGGFLRSLG